MTICEQCRDRLLDFVYGLLEGSELEETRAHLESCPQCRTALEKAQSQRKLMARAALAIADVAEFTLPPEHPTAIPETVTLTPVVATKRSLWRSPWIAWTAAAVILLAITGTISWHQHTVNSLEMAVAHTRKEHKEVVAQFAAVPVKYKVLHDNALGELRSSAAPYLHVVGPTTLQPGAKANIHITAHHPEGTPRQLKDDAAQGKRDFARANLRIKLLDADKVVQVIRAKTDDNGHAAVELDPGQASAGSEFTVLVEADTGSGRANVQEKVRVLTPTFVTRIDTNKIAYQLRDVLFFRVLVLDRYTLQPPADRIALRVELINPQGQTVRSLDAATLAGGMVAGEFRIDEKVADGAYTLRVWPKDAKAPVQSASQPLQIVRELRVPDFQFDEKSYRPGDQLTGIYRGTQPLPAKVMIGKESVQLSTQPVPPPPRVLPSGPDGAAGGGGPPAPGGFGQRFAATIPPNVPKGANSLEMTVPMKDGEGKKDLRANIPLAPTEFAIDFFPEGGDLIAGVLNRVFYRVRSKTGEPVTSDGSVTLFKGADQLPDADSFYKLGMGYFDFTPLVKETYTVRINAAPAKPQDLPVTFQMLPEGVVLQIASLDKDSLPRAVGSQGEPIRLTLRQQGATRKLLLLAECRGQIVDQRFVEVRREPVQVTLNPTQEAVGMIRVTAFEAHGPLLAPVAERLVYRTPAQRLDLSFNVNAMQLRPGPVSAKVTAVDEKGQPAAAWLLASIVDERFQASPRSLSAHFYVVNEIRTGPELDNAQLILHDGPESAQMLERFLGTHGWRRFIRSESTPLDAKRAAQPLIFSRENMPLDQMQRQYEERRELALAPIRKAGFAEQATLETERDRTSEAASAAVASLGNFEARFELWSRLLAGVVLAGLFGTALILMLIGAYRVARADKPATPAFGGAFGCLAACLVMFFVGIWMGPASQPAADPSRVANAPVARELQAALAKNLNEVPAVIASGAAKTPMGPLALQSTRRDKIEMVAIKGDEKASTDAVRAVQEQSKQALARVGPGGGVFTDRDDNRTAKGTAAWDARTSGDKKADVKMKSAKGNKNDSLPQMKEADKAEREYFHQYVANVQSDTLLWAPALLLEAGQADIPFGIASGNATYRVLLLGHTTNGRLGFFETRLDVLGR